MAMIKHRKLKVQGKYQTRQYHYVQVPTIRLEGRWLAALGFEKGQRVRVLEEKGRITILAEGADC